MQTSKSIVMQTTRLYWNHAKRYPLLLGGTLITLPLTIFVSSFLPPLLVSGVLERLSNGSYTKHEVWASFGSSLLLYAVLMILGILIWRLVDVFMWRLEAKVQRDLAHLVFKHLLNQSADFHANSFSGSLVSQTNKLLGAYMRVADTTVYQVMPLIWSLIFTSIILIGRAPLFVGGFITLTILFVITTIKITKPARKQSAKVSSIESTQTGYLSDAIANVMVIKSYSGSDYEYKGFSKATKNTQNAVLKLMRIMQIQMSYSSVVTRSFQILALTSAVISVVVYEANIATVFLVLSFASQIGEQLFTFSNNTIRSYNRSFGDARDMTQILQLKPEITDPDKPEILKINRGEIEFKDVNFAHSGNNDALFKSLGIHIKPGEKIGLIGHSGSGKTTFSRLLLRFSDIDSGAITIDGQDIRSISQDDLHSTIAYVPQETLMFHRSISDNIRYGKFNATQHEIEDAAKMAHANEFIKDLPNGYDTLVGERGVKLSGGQRQRVAIARAMLKNAPILVLDEATSALDSESELLVQDALWKLMEGRTAIVIAHRLSTIQKMDRIIVMDQGQILESGSHKELIQKKGAYAKLWAHQSGGFLED